MQNSSPTRRCPHGFSMIFTNEIVPPPPALLRPRPRCAASDCRRSGRARQPPLHRILTATIRNRNTRSAYGTRGEAVLRLVRRERLELHEIEAVTVAAYSEQLGNQASKPTVKQHLTAIRQLFDYLTTGGILDVIPAVSMRGP